MECVPECGMDGSTSHPRAIKDLPESLTASRSSAMVGEGGRAEEKPARLVWMNF